MSDKRYQGLFLSYEAVRCTEKNIFASVLKLAYNLYAYHKLSLFSMQHEPFGIAFLRTIRGFFAEGETSPFRGGRP